MPPFQQHSRINVQDLKAQMLKRVGPERAHQYFNHFKGYIGVKFNKTELDKLVVLTIGKENIRLHNEIIKAILTNAIRSDTPPPPPSLLHDTSKPVKGVRRKPLLQFAITNDTSRKSPGAGTIPAWSNGTIIGESPRKGQDLCVDPTISRDLGKLGRALVDRRNCAVDTHRPSDNIQGAAEQSDVNLKDGSIHLCKRPRVMMHPSPSMGGNTEGADVLSPSEMIDLKHGEAHWQWEKRALEVPTSWKASFSSMSSASKPPTLRLAGCSYLQLKDAEQDLCHSNDLPMAKILQGHMEQIAEVEGLDGVNEKCVEILNLGIDAFLKRLIQSCFDLVKARSSSQGPQLESQCIFPNRVESLSGGGAQKQCTQDNGFQPAISMLDFKLAMDASPQQLGHNWPLQLERLQLYSFD